LVALVQDTPFHEMPVPKLAEVVVQLVPFQLSAIGPGGVPAYPVAMQAVAVAQET
jgi:hypothetical protein